MTHGESTFIGEGRQAEVPLQVFLRQLLDPLSLPGCQTTFEVLLYITRWAILRHDMRAEEQAKIVKEEFTERVRKLQGRKNDLRQLSQSLVRCPVNASQILNPWCSCIVRERMERGSRNVIVDPIDRTRISSPRIRFEVVNAHASGGPHGNS